MRVQWNEIIDRERKKIFMEGRVHKKMKNKAKY